MFITMCISFFMTRIVLDKLGVSDYGIYNVVGGFVSMFTILNSVLQIGTRRFLALNIGKENNKLLKETFSTAFVIHLILAFVVVLLLETIGLWFLSHKLNIDPTRLYAAKYIFHFSVASVFLNITQTPFTAAVTAHEKFNIYAYLSIFDALAKIIIIYLLIIIPGDKLITYGVLYFVINIISITLYRVYCIKSFSECGLSFLVNRSILKEMFEFSGWSFLGHLSAVLNGQGFSVVLNIFFGTTINAARGLANTVTYTIRQFVDGFITASQPQLVKYYGAGDIKAFHKLIFNVSQYSLFLLSIFIIPVVLEIDYVLELWLDIVPEYTSIFIKITIIICFLSYSNNMLDQGIVASGYIKQLTMITTPIYLLDLPIAYIILRFGASAPFAYVVAALPLFLAFLSNLVILNKYTGFPALKYLINVFFKNIILVLLASIIPLLIQNNMQYGLLRFLVVCFSSLVITILVLYTLGIDKETRCMINNKVKSIINKQSQ